MDPKICFVIKSKDTDEYDKITKDISHIFPNIIFLDIVVGKEETSPEFLQKLNYIDSVENFKMHNKHSHAQIVSFLSHIKVYGTMSNNNIQNAIVISTPIAINTNYNLFKTIKKPPDFYGFINLYGKENDDTHHKCNANFNYIIPKKQDLLKAYIITNEFCKIVLNHVNKICDLSQEIADLSLILKKCYNLKYPFFDKYICKKPKHIKASLPLKKCAINVTDKVYIVKSGDIYVKNITNYKSFYKNNLVVSTLKEAVIEIIKSQKGGLIMNSSIPFFDVFKNIPEYVPETLEYLTWIKKNNYQKIPFNHELDYVSHDMPYMTPFYVTPTGANLLLMIIIKYSESEMNLILSKECVAFVFNVNQ